MEGKMSEMTIEKGNELMNASLVIKKRGGCRMDAECKKDGDE
jgi:hypothetical protein